MLAAKLKAKPLALWQMLPQMPFSRYLVASEIACYLT